VYRTKKPPTLYVALPPLRFVPVLLSISQTLVDFFALKKSLYFGKKASGKGFGDLNDVPSDLVLPNI